MTFDVNNFLYFGYSPEANLPLWGYECNSAVASPRERRVQDGVSILDRTLEKAFNQIPTRSRLIIPLSGGLDSRIILAGAIERFGKEKIVTYTFGSPGQLDYEIGSDIAKKLGLQHFQINLSELSVSIEMFESAAKRAPGTYLADVVFNAAFRSLIPSEPDDYLLSGFLGEAFTGGGVGGGTSPINPLEYFVHAQRRVTNIWLPQKYYSPFETLKAYRRINSVDVLNYYIRQRSCIYPLLFGLRGPTEPPGTSFYSSALATNVVCPFADPEWIDFWLTTHSRDKISQALYREIIRQRYPALCDLPSKDCLGGSTKNSLVYIHRRVKSKVQRVMHGALPRHFPSCRLGFNYVDYELFIRTRQDYQSLVRNAINALEESRACSWLDLEKIFEDHLNFSSNNQQALMTLVGLAANLAVRAKHDTA